MKIFINLFFAAFLVLTCGHPLVQGQTGSGSSDGKAAQLSAAQINSLSTLKVAVAVPTYVPAGYKLRKAEIPKPPPAAGVTDYNLIYENDRGKTFTVQSTNDGIGDMIVKEELSGRNPYFGGEFYAGRDEQDGKTVGVQWIESLKKYQPKTQKIKQYYSLITGENGVSPAVAVRIMKSLRYLKR